MFATPRRLRWLLGGEVHARRKVWRARKLAVRTRNWMYERPSMPRPPYIRVGAEVAISPRGSVFASSTLREQQSDKRSKVSLPANASPPTQTPTGQPCSTGVGNNPLTIPEHSQRAVSRMPKARRSRLSLTRCAGWATFPLCPPSLTCAKNPLSSFNVFLCLYKYRSFSRPFDLYYFDNTPIIPQIGPVLFRHYLSILRGTKSPTP